MFVDTHFNLQKNLLSANRQLISVTNLMHYLEPELDYFYNRDINKHNRFYLFQKTVANKICKLNAYDRYVRYARPGHGHCVFQDTDYVISFK